MIVPAIAILAHTRIGTGVRVPTLSSNQVVHGNCLPRIYILSGNSAAENTHGEWREHACRVREDTFSYPLWREDSSGKRSPGRVAIGHRADSVAGKGGSADCRRPRQRDRNPAPSDQGCSRKFGAGGPSIHFPLSGLLSPRWNASPHEGEGRVTACLRQGLRFP